MEWKDVDFEGLAEDKEEENWGWLLISNKLDQ